jgi:hypothetical protein
LLVGGNELPAEILKLGSRLFGALPRKAPQRLAVIENLRCQLLVQRQVEAVRRG